MVIISPGNDPQIL
jgi:hypothetical protein